VIFASGILLSLRTDRLKKEKADKDIRRRVKNGKEKRNRTGAEMTEYEQLQWLWHKYSAFVSLRFISISRRWKKYKTSALWFSAVKSMIGIFY
jgi:hypothetical protein